MTTMGARLRRLEQEVRPDHASDEGSSQRRDIGSDSTNTRIDRKNESSLC